MNLKKVKQVTRDNLAKSVGLFKAPNSIKKEFNPLKGVALPKKEAKKEEKKEEKKKEEIKEDLSFSDIRKMMSDIATLQSDLAAARQELALFKVQTTNSLLAASSHEGATAMSLRRDTNQLRLELRAELRMEVGLLATRNTGFAASLRDEGDARRDNVSDLWDVARSIQGSVATLSQPVIRPTDVPLFVRPLEVVAEGEERERLECSCCFLQMYGGRPVIMLPCRHYFHQHCLSRWLKIGVNCPLCRGVVPVL